MPCRSTSWWLSSGTSGYAVWLVCAMDWQRGEMRVHRRPVLLDVGDEPLSCSWVWFATGSVSNSRCCSSWWSVGSLTSTVAAVPGRHRRTGWLARWEWVVGRRKEEKVLYQRPVRFGPAGAPVFHQPRLQAFRHCRACNTSLCFPSTSLFRELCPSQCPLVVSLGSRAATTSFLGH